MLYLSGAWRQTRRRGQCQTQIAVPNSWMPLNIFLLMRLLRGYIYIYIYIVNHTYTHIWYIGLLGDCCNRQHEYPSTNQYSGIGQGYFSWLMKAIGVAEGAERTSSWYNIGGYLFGTLILRMLKKTGAPQKETGVWESAFKTYCRWGQAIPGPQTKCIIYDR